MTPRYALAKKKAQQLLADAGITSAPVPVETVAAHIGAQIRYEPFDNEDENLSGMAYRQKDGQGLIGVNALHSKRRQRFTIAHEIAHLTLHASEDLHIDPAFPIGFRDDRSALAIDPKEIEANQFAAELLMPVKWLADDIRGQQIDFEEDDSLIRELAEKYGVSLQAMTIRLSALLH
jgi:Zn-dependent peptidase ImmA (M78 family)